MSQYTQAAPAATPSRVANSDIPDHDPRSAANHISAMCRCAASRRAEVREAVEATGRSVGSPNHRSPQLAITGIHA
jgi:hypothetical protein